MRGSRWVAHRRWRRRVPWVESAYLLRQHICILSTCPVANIISPGVGRPEDGAARGAIWRDRDRRERDGVFHLAAAGHGAALREGPAAQPRGDGGVPFGRKDRWCVLLFNSLSSNPLTCCNFDDRMLKSVGRFDLSRWAGSGGVAYNTSVEAGAVTGKYGPTHP